MSDLFTADLPEEQNAIRAKCFHPTGTFIEFKKEEVEQSVPDRFEKIVRMYPDRIAVKTATHVLTYGELNALANRLARALLKQQVSEMKPVALLFEKDAPLIAAMLGVLKAGRFFVPLDPSLPKQRIEAMLEDSQAELVFTDRQDVSLARDVTNRHHKLLKFASIDYAIPIDNLSLSISPDALAFIIYTSGSTGQPKGVVQNHRNVLHNSMLRTNISHVSPQDRISLLTSGTANTICFTCLALLNGAALFPFDPKTQGVSQLVSWLSRTQISICPISSALFRNLCYSLTGNEAFPYLRLIRLTSETAYKFEVEQFKKYFPVTCILSTGLSTSETGVLTNYMINPRFEFCSSKVPVGYTAEDTEILLLDDAGEQVGCNQVGQIVVRSGYLSPGYWRRAELTQTKFKIDPERGDKRLYFTGDLGLMLPDGCLIHEGRKDFRVQIRGYGVEIAEVEMTLLGHPAIREAVVLGRQTGSVEARLVGYFTSHTQPVPSVSELRAFLKETLPDYMIPSAFMRLDAIPLTLNGKVDRRALPDPDNSRPDLNISFVAPRTSTEVKLAEIWAEVLGVERVGIHDNFFDLGGHSLLVSRLFVQIEKAFAKELSPATLFQAPTIEKLANILRQKDWSTPWSLLFPIQPSGSKLPFFWLYGETSDVFLPRYLGPDQPLYGLMHECRTGKRALRTQIKDIAAYHLKEIRTVQTEGPYFLGGFCFGGLVAFEIAQQLRQQNQKVALLFLLDLATIKNCNFLFDQTPNCQHRLSPIGAFLDKISRHFGDLATLSAREKLTYVRVRVQDRLGSVISNGNNIAEKFALKAYLMTKHPVPLSLHERYIHEVDHRAVRNYQPEAYSDRLILFKAKESSYDSQLVRKLTTDQLEMHEIPCKHADIIKEPYVELWAKELERRLSEAQAQAMRQHQEARLNDYPPGIAATVIA